MIQPFSLAVSPGEIVTLMGPSGCGKSSLLAYIAGDLAEPLAGSGEVILNGTNLTAVAPVRRRIGRLFQDDLLFPHMSVGDNLMFGIARASRAEREARMRAALRETGIEGFEHRKPSSLSGGQRQRVALMRSLLAAPTAMLLDEPFNRLDEELRSSMRELVFTRIAASGIPCLLVSHDRDDAPTGGRVLHISRNGEVRDV